MSRIQRDDNCTAARFHIEESSTANRRISKSIFQTSSYCRRGKVFSGVLHYSLFNEFFLDFFFARVRRCLVFLGVAQTLMSYFYSFASCFCCFYLNRHTSFMAVFLALSASRLCLDQFAYGIDLFFNMMGDLHQRPTRVFIGFQHLTHSPEGMPFIKQIV